MFQMNVFYAFLAIGIMVTNYLVITHARGKGEGIAVMFQGVISQFTRRLLVFLQKAEKDKGKDTWRPAVICLSENSFRSLSLFQIMKWISHKYGFGTYIHLIHGYFSSENQKEAKEDLAQLIKMSNVAKTNLYLDTLISPSYTSAIAQLVQLPGISGQDNNMIVFDYHDEDDTTLTTVMDNMGLINAAKFNLCLLRISEKGFGFHRDIHVWLTRHELENARIMILLAYIISGHADWSESEIRVHAAFGEHEAQEMNARLSDLIISGRLPVSPMNVIVHELGQNEVAKDKINETSKVADLIIAGFNQEYLHQRDTSVFDGFVDVANILFVGSHQEVQTQAV